MAETRRTERRLLSQNELELVDRTHHPVLNRIDDRELRDLVSRIRETRDRAQAIARRQRREMRGKASPAGARPVSDNSGSTGKSKLLAAAVKRVNKERSRRKEKDARQNLSANSHRALMLKREGNDPSSHHPVNQAVQTVNEGMNSIPNDKEAVSGAFNEAGRRPALQRSRGAR